MSTTALVIEHLIIGLQASCWLLMLILTILGFEWVKPSFLTDFTTLLTFLGLSIAYPLGIFMDELADYFFKPWDKKIRKRRYSSEGVSFEDNELTAFYVLQRTDDEFLKTYFKYIRMRIRISRSTALNFFLITFSGFLLIVTKFKGSPKFSLIVFSELSIGILFTVFSVWVWREITDTFSRQIARAFKANPDVFGS
jgi:hypothetical protein